jgi:hypothetical protein
LRVLKKMLCNAMVRRAGREEAENKGRGVLTVVRRASSFPGGDLRDPQTRVPRPAKVPKRSKKKNKTMNHPAAKVQQRLLCCLAEEKRNDARRRVFSARTHAICAVRESNPGHLDGNEVLYH